MNAPWVIELPGMLNEKYILAILPPRVQMNIQSIKPRVWWVHPDDMENPLFKPYVKRFKTYNEAKAYVSELVFNRTNYNGNTIYLRSTNVRWYTK